MNLDNENMDLSQKVNDFLRSNRKIILSALAGILFLGLIVFLTMHFKESARMKTIANVDKVIFELEEFKTKKNAKLEKEKQEAEKKAEGVNSEADKTVENTANPEENKNETDEMKSEKETEEVIAPEIVEKEDSKIEELKALAGKSSTYASFRANTAIAEIYFQRKNYEEALKFYELASKASDTSYIAGVAYFNAASCADELGNAEKALEFYKKASEIKDFPLVPRAMFNAGRIYEAQNKPEEAITAYNKLLEKYPKNEWAFLAKSRVIIIEKN